ncbi:hypothetical protein GMD4S_10956 [Streptococcus sp. GMD4S]|jgi:phosphopantetheine attachment domain protein|uniref:hypothetical protein n=1 Tax=Streptococcus TaxID=1301 RepID=UPI000280D93F|nr:MULTISPECIES: hypothetical protein [Streptococcus]EKA02764.1 hypothetical protein GMD4S_10956 [Streptococcus sp. GMD4S]EKA06681.1 hypothetical protein GMD6S_03403 [Streptococcus sp. GMD6S]EKA10297.1 hypothetical protein GMD2S_09169 [Streptococcus sp. GMD2S]
MKDILNFLKEALENIGIEKEEINNSSSLSDFDLDSTEKVDLSLAIKQEYFVEVALEDDKQSLIDLSNEIYSKKEK